jgi:hypothetical protein
MPIGGASLRRSISLDLSFSVFARGASCDLEAIAHIIVVDKE